MSGERGPAGDTVIGEVDPKDVPVRPAATVMLVRDGPSGIEVLMLRRTTTAVFAAGVHVFPGGRVDPSDDAEVPGAGEWRSGLDPTAADARLAVPAGGRAHWVAALRESFEEAGLLIARRSDGAPLTFSDRAEAARFATYRQAVHRGELAFGELCRRERLVLPLDELRYVSHWVTPVGPPRRFDTRFFVARAPQGQDPAHDDSETIASEWLAPDAALERHEAGEIGLFAPTIANLGFLSVHDSVDAVLRTADGLGTVPRRR